MRYKIGRFLQLLGLILLPVGMAGNLAQPKEISPGIVLFTLVTGAAIFAIGYLLQQSSNPR